MFGKPEDVEGECNAHLYVGDDYGDNEATMRCRLKPGHKGPHEERYEFAMISDPFKWNKVVVSWTQDCRADRRGEKQADEGTLQPPSPSASMWEDELPKKKWTNQP